MQHTTNRTAGLKDNDAISRFTDEHNVDSRIIEHVYIGVGFTRTIRCIKVATTIIAILSTIGLALHKAPKLVSQAFGAGDALAANPGTSSQSTKSTKTNTTTNNTNTNTTTNNTNTNTTTNNTTNNTNTNTNTNTTTNNTTEQLTSSKVEKLKSTVVGDSRIFYFPKTPIGYVGYMLRNGTIDDASMRLAADTKMFRACPLALKIGGYLPTSFSEPSVISSIDLDEFDGLSIQRPVAKIDNIALPPCALARGIETTLAAVTRWTRLGSLDVADVPLTNRALQEICKLKELKILKLRRVSFIDFKANDASPQKVSLLVIEQKDRSVVPLPILSFMRFSPVLTDVHFVYSSLTLDGMHILRKYKVLKNLFFEDTKLDDKALRGLAQLNTVTTITFRNVAISVEQVNWLRKHVPHIEMINLIGSSRTEWVHSGVVTGQVRVARE
jgi:hypothetical protein